MEKQENEFDAFRRELMDYEGLVLKQQAARAEVDRIEKELSEVRHRLFKRRVSLSIKEAPVIRRPRKEGKPKPKTPSKAEQVLEKQDPRVKRTLGELVHAIGNWPDDSISLTDLAKSLKISKGAVSLRVTKAGKLGLVKRAKRGYIALVR